MHVIDELTETLGSVLLGKKTQIKLALCCLVAEGHLLIEDIPGVGKTTLAQGLARVVGLDYQRVQFTSDLLPGDILGVSIFDQQSHEFQFREGPIFTQVLLADEINRSSPKTQSALLEAMEEKQVTMERDTRKLPEPFFVIATQNPLSQSGTYPLPESQLDRFLMSLSLGYPDRASEKKMLMGQGQRVDVAELKPVITMRDLKSMQDSAQQVSVSEAVVEYIQRLVEFTRESQHFSFGLSPRAALALLRAAKSWAYIHQREYLLPDDVQAVLPAVAEHRIQGSILQRAELDFSNNGEPINSLSALLLQSVDVLG
jgi:MoxR-like ATPase